MMNNTLSVKRYIFKWNIDFFNSCLIYTEGILKSPKFQVENPMSSWHLELNLSAASYFQIRLCRQLKCAGSPEINVRFLMTFKTLHGTEEWESESWLSFLKGSRSASKFVLVPSFLKTDETVVVTCDMILNIDEPRYFIDQNLTGLPEDFKWLFNCNNVMERATLIVGEQEIHINVHKEILCARSTVFNDFFRRHDGEFPIRNYSPEVIISMLKFLYYGDIDDLADIFTLWNCAMEFGVSHLIDILRPNFLLATSEFRLENIEFRWNYRNFIETIDTKCLVDDTGVRMFDIAMLESRVTFKTTMYVFVTKNRTPLRRTLFDVEMWDLPASGRFPMRMSVRDNNDNVHFEMSELITPNSDRTCRFPIWIENTYLFGTETDSFSRHVKFTLTFGSM